MERRQIQQSTTKKVVAVPRATPRFQVTEKFYQDMVNYYRSVPEKKIVETLLLRDISADKLFNVRLHLSGIPTEDFREALRDESNNMYTMEVGSLIFRALLYTPPILRGVLLPAEIIRSMLTNLVTVNVTPDSYVFDAGFGTTEKVLRIKTAPSPRHDILTHEAIIMREITNDFRQILPNFLYLYSQFGASPAFIDPHDKRVLSWGLHSGSEVNYLLLERVSDVTFKDELVSCTPDKFLRIYMQVLLAIRFASSKYNFTHYNLLPENIALRRLDETIQINYDTDQGTKYLTTDVVAVITNFTCAHAEKNGRIYGRNGLSAKFVSPDQSLPISDAYQLLMSSLFEARRNNNESLMTTLKSLYRFFNETTDPADVLDDQAKQFFRLPVTKRTKSLTLDSYLQYVRAHANVSFVTERDNSHILYACGHIENDLPTRLKIISSAPLSAHNFFGYYDTVTLLRNSGRIPEAETLRRGFDYITARKNFVAAYDIVSRQLENARNVPMLDLSKFTIKSILTLETLNNIQNMYSNVMIMNDDRAVLLAMEKVARAVGNDFNVTKTEDGKLVATPIGVDTSREGDQLLLNTIIQARERFETLTLPHINEVNALAKKNDAILDALIKTPSYQKAIKTQPALKWYGTDRLNIQYIDPTVQSTASVPVDFKPPSLGSNILVSEKDIVKVKSLESTPSTKGMTLPKTETPIPMSPVVSEAPSSPTTTLATPASSTAVPMSPATPALPRSPFTVSPLLARPPVPEVPMATTSYAPSYTPPYASPYAPSYVPSYATSVNPALTSPLSYPTQNFVPTSNIFAGIPIANPMRYY